MRVPATLLTILVLTLVSGLPLAAQCLPDCPETDFDPLQNYTITLPGDCQIRVTYAKRKACGIWQDLYIEHISTVPSPPSPACQAYWSMSAGDLLWLVTEQMAQDNPMGFTKPMPGCTTDWRVIKGECWFQRFDPLPERYSSSYCNAETCCLEAYEVCFDDCGNVSCFEPQSTYPASGELCYTDHHGDCTAACGNPSWSKGGSCL